MNPAEFQADTPFASFGTTVADAPVDARRTFIRKTYTHLAAAIYAFVAIEFLLFQTQFPEWFASQLTGQWSWLIVLGAFMVVSWIADSWARSSTSIGIQYAGLFLYVLAEAIIFVPLLYIANDQTITFDAVGRPVSIIPAAAVTTLAIFGGLTAVTFLTKKDFSFLGGILGIAMFGALALIVISIFTGFSLGVWFCWLMVVAASGYILYYTSNVIHHYRTDQYVAASLALFASVALLLWYVIQIFLASRD